MEEGLLIVYQSRLVDEYYYIYTFSTWDLREQDHKSYVASYRVNEELVIANFVTIGVRVRVE